MLLHPKTELLSAVFSFQFLQMNLHAVSWHVVQPAVWYPKSQGGGTSQYLEQHWILRLLLWRRPGGIRPTAHNYPRDWVRLSSGPAGAISVL